MESSLDTFLQFIKKHPGCTKYDIARAEGFDTRWINKQLYAELKKEKSRIFSDDNTPPRWFYKESDKGRTQNEQASPKTKFVPDAHTLKVMKYVDEGKNVFVTGKAGTGKTRLLEEIYNTNNEKPRNLRKVTVVLAPTGVAAEHIQESAGIDAHTIHSFFKLPLTPYVAGHKNDALLELKEEQIDAIKELDMLIIDEISMVRCDVLDAVDTVLRYYRKNKNPFGGVQIVLFGDLYQLMPVAKSEEWRKIEEYYETYYFFSSHALAGLEYYYCELMTPHRHRKDDVFIKVLNNVRESKMTLEDLQVINSRLISDMPQNIDDNVVILMTKNRKVNNHNKEELSKISNPVVTYRANYDENWHGKKPIEPPTLNLKIGAKVMFVKNDTLEGEYRNGTIGHIVELEEDYIQVKIDN